MTDGRTTGVTRSAGAKATGATVALERTGVPGVPNRLVAKLQRELGEASRLGRYVLREALRPDAVTVNGCRFELPATISPHMRDVIYRENFGRAEVRAIRATLRPGDVVVDAGAGIGFVGVHMARIVGARNLHLIEANRDLVPCILRNFALNGLEAPDVHLGVASADAAVERVEFNVMRDFWVSSAEATKDAERRDEVPVIDVNRLIRDHGASVVLMDIEGGEYELVPRCDVQGVRAFIVEVHRVGENGEKLHAMFKSLVDRGFVVDMMIDDNLYVFKRAV